MVSDDPFLKSGDFTRLDTGVMTGIEQRVQRTRDAITTDPGALACAHIINEQKIAMVCAEHPAAGYMCISCFYGHLERHTDDIEHRCDECGQHAKTLASIVSKDALSGIVRGTAGTRRLYLGPVLVMCLGVCPPCADRLGVEFPPPAPT